LLRQRLHVFRECIHDRAGVLGVDLYEQQIAGLSLDERGDVGVGRTGEEVAFPMPGDRTILGPCRTIADTGRTQIGFPKKRSRSANSK